MKTIVFRSMVAAALVVGASAQARGSVIDPAILPAEVRVSLEKEIARAKQVNPGAFSRVARVAQEAETLDARKRGRLAPISPILKRMGSEALWPMVERIAFKAEGGPESESAKLALDVGLIEAAGALRDERLAPVWKAALSGTEQRKTVLRAAAGSLARLDTEDAATTLVALSKGDDLRAEAALAMMGHCRRLSVAKRLADVLDATPAGQSRAELVRAKQVMEALGDVGNSWAWKTPAIKARSEEGAVRQTAAEALVRAYVRYDGTLRDAASNALMVVDAPGTPALISQAKKNASDELKTALDVLAERFTKNPAR